MNKKSIGNHRRFHGKDRYLRCNRLRACHNVQIALCGVSLLCSTLLCQSFEQHLEHVLNPAGFDHNRVIELTAGRRGCVPLEFPSSTKQKQPTVGLTLGAHLQNSGPSPTSPGPGGSGSVTRTP
jgi:hypothetical protein